MKTKYVIFPFKCNGLELESGVDAPVAGMTLRAAGSMRFRWNETNPVREQFMNQLLQELNNYDSSVHKQFIPAELIHSHLVLDVRNAFDTHMIQADGLITKNTQFIPTVTVADCMPVYLWDPVTKVFGIVHSGWKGTGIAWDAIKLAQDRYGSKPEDFCVILGPHIQDCCYIVNKERADFFSTNFGPDCVKELEEGGKCYCGGRGFPVDWNNGGGQLYRLSLKKANLNFLEKAGVKPENINVIDECTCCNEKFGSNRRETVLNGAPDQFTVQAAFISRQKD